MRTLSCGIMAVTTAAAGTDNAQDYFAWYAQRFGIEVGHARDLFEVALGQVVETDFPKPLGFTRTIEYMGFGVLGAGVQAGIESMLRDLGYQFRTISDNTAVAAQSSGFDAVFQQRASAEDRVAQQVTWLQQAALTLAKIAQELHEVDRRMAQYVESEQEGDAGAQADAGLKSRWVQVVEGGAVNPNGLFAVAHQLNASDLPDMFFGLRRLPLGTGVPGAWVREAPACNAALAQSVRDLPVSARLQDVLIQKLTRYYGWKDATWRELGKRRGLLLQSVRTYHSEARLQLASLTTSLRALRRQNLSLGQLDLPELPGTFEVRLRAVDLLARKLVSARGPYAVVLVSIQCLGRAQANARERAPVPERVIVQYRAYCWTDEDIEHYIAYRQGDDVALFEEVSGDLWQQLLAVEQDLMVYLRELGITAFLRKPQPTIAAPPDGLQRALGRAVGIIAKARAVWQWRSRKTVQAAAREAEERATRAARKDAFACYNTLKKQYGLPTW
ncbi:MAG: hypothetical protein ABSE73_00085 [Planctomycetota bacterium]